MSFSMTKDAFLSGQKTVTRRVGWRNLKAGDVLMAVEKSQGLKKGEKVVKLGPFKIVSVRREPLDAIEREGFVGTSLEGLPELSPTQFCHKFAQAMKCRTDSEVARIEFVRVMGECPNCEAEGITPTVIICDECVVENGLADCVGEEGCPVEAPGWLDGDEVTCRDCGRSFVARCDEGRVNFRERVASG